MARPLVVNALELLRRPGSQKELAVEVNPVDLELDREERLAPDQPIAVRLECSSTNDGIVVDGAVVVKFRGVCRRCLRAVTGEQVIEVHELYQETRRDPDAFPIENDQIDLRPMVRESILLDVPEAPVCRADCPGLCPVCGVDLATETCSCETSSADPRWAVLSEIRDSLPE